MTQIILGFNLLKSIILLIFITALLTVSPVIANSFLAKQVPYAEYKSVHDKLDVIQGLLQPVDALSFISEPAFFLNLAKYPLLPDPSLNEWAAARLVNQTKSAAYRQFLLAKYALEQYPNLLTTQPNRQGEEIAEVLDFAASLKIFAQLNQSLTETDNAWTRLYRGMSLAWLRAFQPALADLRIAQRKFAALKVEQPLSVTEKAIQQVLAWQQGNDQAPQSVIKPTLETILTTENLSDWKQLSADYLAQQAFRQETQLLAQTLPLLTKTAGIPPIQLALRDVFLQDLPLQLLHQRFALYQLTKAEQQMLDQLYRRRLIYQSQVGEIAQRFYQRLSEQLVKDNRLTRQQQQYVWHGLQGGFHDLLTMAMTAVNLEWGLAEIGYFFQTMHQVWQEVFADARPVWQAQQAFYRALAETITHPQVPSYLKASQTEVTAGLALLEQLVPDEKFKVFLAPLLIERIYAQQLLGKQPDLLAWLRQHRSAIKTAFEQPTTNHQYALIAEFITVFKLNPMLGQSVQAHIEDLQALLTCITRPSLPNNGCQVEMLSFSSQLLLGLMEDWRQTWPFFNHQPELFQALKQVNQKTLATLSTACPPCANSWSTWLAQFYQHLNHQRQNSQLARSSRLALNALVYGMAHIQSDAPTVTTTQQDFSTALKAPDVETLPHFLKITFHLVNLLMSEAETDKFNSLQQLAKLTTAAQEPIIEILSASLTLATHSPQALRQFNLDPAQMAKYQTLFSLPTPSQLEQITTPAALLLTLVSPSFYRHLSPTEITTLLTQLMETRFQGQQRQVLKSILLLTLKMNRDELNADQLKALRGFTLPQPVKLDYQLPLSIEYIEIIPYIMPHSEWLDEATVESNNLSFGIGASQEIGPIMNFTLTLINNGEL